MILPKKDAELFYKLMWPLLFHANRKYQVIKGLNSPDFSGKDKGKILELHEKLFSHPQVIDGFVSENPFKFNEEELAIIKSWKNSVKDTFIIMSHLKDCSVLLQACENPRAYGVLGIKTEIEEFTPFLPIMAETILLPFKGKIIYCGIINPYPVHIGSNMRRGFNADYQKAKSRFGIIASLETPVSSFQEDRELPIFLRHFAAKIKTSLVKGNHDGDIEKLTPSGIKIYPSSGFGIKNFWLAHGQSWPPPDVMGCEYLVIGHDHPAVQFRDMVGSRSVEQCWLVSKPDREKLEKKYGAGCRLEKIISVPVFNRLIGGMPFNRPFLKKSACGKTKFKPLSPILQTADWKHSEVYLLDGTFLGTLDKMRKI